MYFDEEDMNVFQTLIYRLAERFPAHERGAQGLYWLGYNIRDNAGKVRVWEDLRKRYDPQTFSWSAGGMSLLYQAYLEADRYAFTLPPQLAETPLVIAVGDARARARVVPLLRPEITDVLAEVRLPEYLERPEPQRVDVRSGVLAPVKGSSVAIVATANRALASARVDGSAVVPQGATVRTAPVDFAVEAPVPGGWLLMTVSQ